MDFEQQCVLFLARAARKRELEESIPTTRLRLAEVKESLPLLSTDVAAAKYDVEKLENPGFFRRLLGNSEEKLDRARQALRKATITRNNAQRELAELSDRVQKEQTEFDDLLCYRQEYLAFLDAHREHPNAHVMHQQFVCAEAIEALTGLLRALAGAHPSMVTDVRYRGVYEGNRKLFFLEEADRFAGEFRELLRLLPEGLVTVGQSLGCPSVYVQSASMEHAQLDRVNTAIEQARKAREILRGYQRTL